MATFVDGSPDAYREAFEGDFALGQIWKDRRNKPSSVALITDIYHRSYSNGGESFRVKLTVISQTVTDNRFDNSVIGENDIDIRSFKKMYPYLVFNPIILKEPENK